MEKESSMKEQTSSYLMGMLKEKDDKIGRLKSKIEKLKKECSDNKDREDKNAYMTSVAVQNPSSFLNQINRATGNRLESVDDCVMLIKRLTEEQQKKMKRDYSKDEFKEHSPLNSDKQRRYDVEIEELKDTVYDMEMKLSLQEKKFKSRLKQKDDEIEELNDEIEIMKSLKQKDVKAKARVSDLEETIEDLNIEIESKVEEIKMKDKKIKELMNEKNNVIVDNDEISRLKTKHDQEIRRLRNEASNITQKLEQQITELQDTAAQNQIMLDKRSVALDTMKEKIKANKENIRELEDRNDELNKQLNECRTQREVDTETNVRASKQNELMKIKINNLEREMTDLRAREFGGRAQRTPPFAMRHRIPEAEVNRASQPATLGRQFQDDDDRGMELESLDRDALKRACPNCHVIFGEHELGRHLTRCLEQNE